jgi:hypothetical protein
VTLNDLPTLCLFVVFSCLYAFVPNATVRARKSLLGGLLSTPAFKMAFTLSWFSQYFVYSVIYGALAMLSVFLLWFFFGLGDRPSRRDFRPLDGLYPFQRQVLSARARHRRDF